jgi:hypothetical protein
MKSITQRAMSVKNGGWQRSLQVDSQMIYSATLERAAFFLATFTRSQYNKTTKQLINGIECKERRYV